ncbi:MAG: colicin immunity domain-containing protein [Thermomicrobiales bacterium]
MDLTRLQHYRQLIGDYLDGAMPITEFRLRYIAAWKAETSDLPSDLYEILWDVFCILDLYTPRDIRDDAHLSEAQVQEDAQKNLAKLDEYIEHL